MTFPTDRVREYAYQLGFNLIGIAPGEPSPFLDAYFRWINAGMHGEMGYMARADRIERRRDMNAILPGIRSIIVVGLDYHVLGPSEAILSEPTRGRIAAYAWGADYHDVLLQMLRQLVNWLVGEAGQQSTQRVYVDTGAILERSHGWRAGMGFTGKNTMLIHLRRGSHFFLGEILTTLEFDTYDQPGRESLCGTCQRCLTACPTEAFPAPYVLDARRCISYLTIEHRGPIEPMLRPRLGNWVFGCDICQDVCPFQRFTQSTTARAFEPLSDEDCAPKLMDLLALDEPAFRQRYYGRPVHRIRRERLVRNACIAAGNSGAESLAPALRSLLGDTSGLIRSHAAWALDRLLGPEAKMWLRAYADRETEPEHRDAIRRILGH